MTNTEYQKIINHLSDEFIYLGNKKSPCQFFYNWLEFTDQFEELSKAYRTHSCVFDHCTMEIFSILTAKVSNIINILHSQRDFRNVLLDLYNNILHYQEKHQLDYCEGENQVKFPALESFITFDKQAMDEAIKKNTAYILETNSSIVAMDFIKQMVNYGYMPERYLVLHLNINQYADNDPFAQMCYLLCKHYQLMAKITWRRGANALDWYKVTDEYRNTILWSARGIKMGLVIDHTSKKINFSKKHAIDWRNNV